MKKGFNIAANVCAIVLMGILIIGAIVLMSATSSLSEAVDDTVLSASADLIIGICVGIILFCVATIMLYFYLCLI